MIQEKIKAREDLKPIVDGLKKDKKTVVFTNGCFDILHYGHVKYLEEAKGIGDILIVAVNSDSSVREIKGEKRPIIQEDARLKVVAALESVDYVTIFDEDTPFETIRLIEPTVIVKGGDWDVDDIVGSDIVKGLGGKTVTIPFVEGYSTSKMIESIKKSG